MGTTTVAANLDDEVLLIEYRREIEDGEDESTVPLSVSITRESVTAFGSQLNISIVSQSNIDGGILVRDGDTQTMQIRLINPRYRDHLYVTVDEVRDGTPIQTKVPVLLTTDSVVTPSNPVRDESELIPQPTDNLIGTYRPAIHEENERGLPVGNNNIYPEPSLLTYLYFSDVDGLKYTQKATRAIVEEDGSINTSPEGYLVENGSFNMLPNPGFADPLGWTFVAPGLSASLLINDTNVTWIRKLLLSVSDPNPFSAMDLVTISSPTSVVIPPGQQYLSFSLSVRLRSSASSQDFYVSIVFLDLADNELNSTVHTESLIASKSFTNIQKFFLVPPLAAKVVTSFGISSIATGLVADFLWPQLEPSAVATSRVYPIGSGRLLDVLTTTKSLQLSAPMFVDVRLIFRSSEYILGLLDTTDSLTSGLQWSVTGNVMTMVIFDSIGDPTYVTSDPFSLTDGDETSLSFYITGTDLEFYVNGTILSTHPVGYSLPNAERPVLIGCLNQANQTVQSEILSFRYGRNKPW